MTGKRKAEPTAELRAAMKQIGGTDDHDFNLDLLCRTTRTVWLNSDQRDRKGMGAVGGIAHTAMLDFKPTDAVEAMLSGQAVALHFSAMECARRAVLPDQTIDGAARSWREAANLSRTMVEMVDALRRWRNEDSREAERDGQASG